MKVFVRKALSGMTSMDIEDIRIGYWENKYTFEPRATVNLIKTGEEYIEISTSEEKGTEILEAFRAACKGQQFELDVEVGEEDNVNIWRGGIRTWL